MGIVEFEDVSKVFKTYPHGADRLKEFLTAGRLRRHEKHWALRDVSFDIHEGETFCIVGENGSGKTTLLKLIAGILRPSSGTVHVHGRVAALLELGSGFNSEFSGRENVFLNGTLLGLTTREIAQRLDEIFAFAELGKHVDQPLKTYSSGMVMRLAFSIAVQVHPEILIVDEALSVGDIRFAQRCMHKIHELRERGVTIIFVSHNIGDVKALGDRTLWLEQGRIAKLGDTKEVTLDYMAALVKKDAVYLRGERAHGRAERRLDPPKEVITSLPKDPKRHGDGRGEVLGITVVDEQGRPLQAIVPGQRIVARISVRARQEVRLPIVGCQLRNDRGMDFSGTNTSQEDVALPIMQPGDVITADFHLYMPGFAAEYITFTPAFAEGTVNEFAVCDIVENALRLPVRKEASPGEGLLSIPFRAVTYGKVSSPAREAVGSTSGSNPR